MRLPMRTEYENALQRLQAPRLPPEASGPVFDDPAYRMAVRSADAKRRGEIEAAMREDGGRRYWNDPAMQREYNGVLTRQTAPPAMPAPEQAAPTPSQKGRRHDEIRSREAGGLHPGTGFRARLYNQSCRAANIARRGSRRRGANCGAGTIQATCAAMSSG
jgi:hypothetical protein